MLNATDQILAFVPEDMLSVFEVSAIAKVEQLKRIAAVLEKIESGLRNKP